LFTKPRWALISLLTMVLAYKPFSKVVPFRFSSSFNKVRSKASLRIMSWNVASFNIRFEKEHPEVKPQMIDLINEYQPDIACFQEMVCEDGDEHMIGHVDDYMKQLEFTNYFYAYNPKDDYKRPAHFGIMIFSKFPIINRKTLPDTVARYNDFFQYADIVKGSDTFRVFNIHLQSLRFNKKEFDRIEHPTADQKDAVKESENIISKFKHGFTERKAQADRVHAEIARSPYPVILCGDFNDVPNSYAYHTVGQGLKNAFEEKAVWLGRTFSGIAPTLRIDNIFVDNKMNVEQYLRVRKKLSDHFPIFSDVSMKK